MAKHFDTFDSSKIEANLRGVPPGSKVIVLVTNGSYAPPHKMHRKTMEAAKAELEKRGERVVGGFLTPSGDVYVHNKLKEEFISHKDRYEMTKMLVADSDWLSCLDWDYFDAIDVAAETRRHLARVFEGKYDFEVVKFYGINTLHRHPNEVFDGERTVTYIREGCTLDQLRELVGDDGMKKVIVAAGCLDDTSSTMIRDAIHRKDYALIAKLSTSDVAKYLEDNHIL